MNIGIIIKMLLKVLIVAPFFSLWFFVDTAIGFVRDGLEESTSPQRDHHNVDIRV